MDRYIQIKINGQSDANYKKIRVLFGSGSYPYSVNQGKTINRCLDGSMSKQVGPRFKRIYGTFRVKSAGNDLDSTYASRTDLETWMTDASAANQMLVVKLWDGTTLNVAFVSEYDPQPQTPLPDMSNGFYYIPFELQER